jgi:hypothetical protein
LFFNRPHRFRQEICAEKRPLAAFETDLAQYRQSCVINPTIYDTCLLLKYVPFQLAEAAVTRNLFAAIVNRIPRLAILPPVVGLFRV